MSGFPAVIENILPVASAVFEAANQLDQFFWEIDNAEVVNAGFAGLADQLLRELVQGAGSNAGLCRRSQLLEHLG